jgi:hypothetical protein
MAYSREDWDVVKAFYERGLSLSEIVAREEVVITDRSTISKEAKKKGWVKGSKSTTVEKEVTAKQMLSEVRVEKSTYNSTEAEIHADIVNRKLDALEFYATSARLVAKIGLKALTDDRTSVNAKITMDTLEKGLKVEGAVPYYPNQPTFSNTNAQQNNEIRTITIIKAEEQAIN